MSNLTQTEKVAREVSLDPIPGHALVIYKRVGIGKTFFAELSPEEQFKEKKTNWWKRFTSDPPSYIAYAVNLNEALKLKITKRVMLQNQVNSFDLIISVSYHVSSRRRVADRYDDDPLDLLQNEIIDLFKENVANNEWDAIKNSFSKVAEEALACTRGEIDKQAEKLGFHIETIKIDRQLLEKDIKVERRLGEAEAEQRLREIEQQSREHKAQLEHQSKVGDLQRQDIERNKDLDLQINRSPKEDWVRDNQRMHKLKDGGVEAGIKAMSGVGDEIKTPRQFKEVIDMVQSISPRRSPGEMGQHNREIGAPSAPYAYLPEQSGDVGKLPRIVDLLARTYREVDAVDYSAAEKNRLLSILLHLAAESMLGDEADEAKLKDYQEHLKEVVVGLSHFPPELERFIRDNFRSLRERFKKSAQTDAPPAY